MLRTNRWLGLMLVLLLTAVRCVAQSTPDEKAAKTVLDSLVHGDYAKVTTLFDAGFKKALSAEQIKQGWETELKTLGAFEKQEGIRTRKTPDGRTMVVITSKFTRGRLDTQVYFSPQHQINGLFLTTPPEYRKNSPNEAAARLVVKEMAAGQFDKVAANFDKTMTEKLPISELSSNWQKVKASAGEFQSITGVVVEAKGGYERVALTCKFAQVVLDILVTYDKAGKIAGLFITPHSS